MQSEELGRLLRRGVDDVIVDAELRALLEKGDPLRLKLGVDPSQPDLTLGHVVPLRKLRQLQELGHQVVLIIGDWTARIGDPSGQSATRPQLSAEEVRANAETYMRQFFKIVDRDRTEVRWQSEWYGDFDLEDLIRLTSRFTVAQILARDDFQRRLAEHRPLSIVELLYPLLQAYDSVIVQAGVEFGGTDQRFNILLGRELQQMMGQRPQQVLLVPLLVGTDGVQKMSKSLDNYIAVEDPPREMFGKTMSLADGLILDYFELLTDVPDEELEEFRRRIRDVSANPMELKKRLGRELVAQFHGLEEAREAQEEFERVFQARQAPEDALTISGQQVAPWLVSATGGLMVNLPGLLAETGLSRSTSEARRLIGQGGVDVDGERVEGFTWPVREGSVLKVGRRRWARLVDLPQG